MWVREFLDAKRLYEKYYSWLVHPEQKEQADLVLWLEQKDYRFTSIPNSTYIVGWKQKIVNKILGLRAGLSDMLIILKSGKLLFVELKKKKVRYLKQNGALWKVRTENKPSKEQLAWKKDLSSIKNVYCEVAYGCKNAIDIIGFYEKK